MSKNAYGVAIAPLSPIKFTHPLFTLVVFYL